MMTRALFAFSLLVAIVACDRLPGRPRPADRPVRPSAVVDYATLYRENCAGCHGGDGHAGAAVALEDPLYLAFADDAVLRRVTAQGVAGTAMPAFARAAGGTLTDAQIEIVVAGLRARQNTAAIGGASPPAYAGASGDAQRGAQVYANRCAACHGPTGAGTAKGGSIVDGSYLALVSDQDLRTAVVVGRPGMPDWRGIAPDPPMSASDVADVVAWLAARRVALPGQPYPAPPQRGHDDG